MPIVFVHGVANRNGTKDYDDGLRSITRLLKEYVCPVLSRKDPESVRIIAPYWGGMAAKFAWNRESCPSGSLLGMGAGSEAEASYRTAILLGDEEKLRLSLSQPDGRDQGFRAIALGPGSGASVSAIDLSSLTSRQISDLASTIIREIEQVDEERARLSVAADRAAHDPAFLQGLRAKATPEEQTEFYLQFIRTELDKIPKFDPGFRGGPLPMGAASRFRDALLECLSRAKSLPGSAATKVLSEVRGDLNRFITLFLGDVFTYIANRGTREVPGEIPALVIEALKEARKNQLERDGEPIVVLTHSMGGQIVYDIVTGFQQKLEAAGIKIHLWCATASQVALFEEMKLFMASSPDYSAEKVKKAPFPSANVLASWWNVWDPNDFISFTGKTIFEGISDEPYESGLSVATAHGGYLVRPSFYRRLAERVSEGRPP